MSLLTSDERPCNLDNVSLHAIDPLQSVHGSWYSPFGKRVYRPEAYDYSTNGKSSLVSEGEEVLKKIALDVAALVTSDEAKGSSSHKTVGGEGLKLGG